MSCSILRWSGSLGGRCFRCCCRGKEDGLASLDNPPFANCAKDGAPEFVPQMKFLVCVGFGEGFADDGGDARAEEFDGVEELVVVEGGYAHLEADAGDASEIFV